MQWPQCHFPIDDPPAGSRCRITLAIGEEAATLAEEANPLDLLANLKNGDARTFNNVMWEPERWPAEPAEPGSEWYGTADLWTVLALDGSYTPRKSVWWSANYTDPGADPFPEIEVVWHRLDTETEDITNDGLGTNGSTAEDGLFIIAGLDPNRSGCWKVTATYGDASLSYVYEKLPG